MLFLPAWPLVREPEFSLNYAARSLTDLRFCCCGYPLSTGGFGVRRRNFRVLDRGWLSRPMSVHFWILETVTVVLLPTLFSYIMLPKVCYEGGSGSSVSIILLRLSIRSPSLLGGLGFSQFMLFVYSCGLSMGLSSLARCNLVSVVLDISVSYAWYFTRILTAAVLPSLLRPPLAATAVGSASIREKREKSRQKSWHPHICSPPQTFSLDIYKAFSIFCCGWLVSGFHYGPWRRYRLPMSVAPGALVCPKRLPGLPQLADGLADLFLPVWVAQVKVLSPPLSL